LAADGHGVAATGELLAPMVVPVRAAADRDRAAAAGAADPVSPRPSRYRQLRVAVYRGPAAVAGAVGPANPPSNSASDDEDDFANPPPGRLFFEDSRNPFMSEEEI
jgi:hypothetical protein